MGTELTRFIQRFLKILNQESRALRTLASCACTLHRLMQNLLKSSSSFLTDSREPLNQSAAALSGSFAPAYRFENPEIRKGFLQFLNLNSEQNPSLTALAIESEFPLKRKICPSAFPLRGRMVQRPGGTLWRCRSATNLKQFGNKNGRFSRKTCHFCAIARSAAVAIFKPKAWHPVAKYGSTKQKRNPYHKKHEICCFVSLSLSSF